MSSEPPRRSLLSSLAIVFVVLIGPFAVGGFAVTVLEEYGASSDLTRRLMNLWLYFCYAALAIWIFLDAIGVNMPKFKKRPPNHERLDNPQRHLQIEHLERPMDEGFFEKKDD